MIAAVPTAIAALSADGWGTAASTIMTTDTIAKGASRRVQTAQGEVTVTGIAKGVGMIEPHMATMLAFIATDARLSATAVDAALRGAVDESFNCVTVDSDTSTNDSCVLCATARARTREIAPEYADFPPKPAPMRQVCIAHP